MAGEPLWMQLFPGIVAVVQWFPSHPASQPRVLLIAMSPPSFRSLPSNPYLTIPSHPISHHTISSWLTLSLISFARSACILSLCLFFDGCGGLLPGSKPDTRAYSQNFFKMLDAVLGIHIITHDSARLSVSVISTAR